MLHNLPPFIESQGFRLLKEDMEVKDYLRPEHFRTPRSPTDIITESISEAQEVWLPIERDEIVSRIMGENSPAFRHLVITGDAGIGKTTNMKWLNYALNKQKSDSIAFFINLAQLNFPHIDGFEEVLLSLLNQAKGNAGESFAKEQDHYLRNLRDKGKLILLFDGLDQLREAKKIIELLQYLISDKHWGKCRIVISGRPYSLQVNWESLFRDKEWRFIKLEEFTKQQQQFYLGTRFDILPPESREILSVPRVLEYLRELSEVDLKSVQTPSDVYWKAINNMLMQGLASGQSEILGAPANIDVSYQIELSLKLLASIGFEMTASSSFQSPNFESVRCEEMKDFRERIFHRVSHPDYNGEYRAFRRDLNCLEGMNTFLSRGFFDIDGLEEIHWRNRTLQEFFAGLWLANYSSDDDIVTIKNWGYIPREGRTEEYYWIWRFIVEMPEEARSLESWIRAITPLYAPGDGTPEGTKRSNEMIYRSWQKLEQYSANNNRASRLYQNFLGEFETQIVSGSRGIEIEDAASDFKKSFQKIEGGTFYMGAPTAKQGIPLKAENAWEKWFKNYKKQNSKIKKLEFVKQLIRRYSFSSEASDGNSLETELKWWISVGEEQNLSKIINRFYFCDEMQ